MEVQKPALGCRLAPPVPKGTVIQDIRQKKWKVGKPIGSGAFGDIYLARFAEREEEEYVIKVEPHSNGPLFVEIHAFLRLGLEHHRVDWVPRNHKPQGWVGIPNYYGSGSFYIGNERLRFLVLSRLGSDIQKFFQSGEKPLPLTTALNISVQILESLEFIHSKNYTHNDIKAQNVLLGFGQDKETVYLVDFGLACKYRDQMGFHRGAEPDERKAHEGTLEYTSRDAHEGKHSRRGDLETLGYNMVHWITGYLPWTNITDPEKVQAQKLGFMFNIPGFLEKCFKPNKYPKVLENYLSYVTSLQFDEAPDYSKLRKLLIQSMRSEGVEPYSPLVFSDKCRILREESSDEEEEMVQEGTRNTRSQDEEERFAPWSWEQVLAQDPESIIRQASRSSEQDGNEDETERTEAFNQQQLQLLANPTPEMHRILIARELQEKIRQGLSWKEQLQEYNQRQAQQKEKFANMDLEPRENTPAMEAVIQRRAERLAAGIDTPMTPEPSDDEGETHGATVDTVVKAKKPGGRMSTRSSRSVTPTEQIRSRSATPTESPSVMFSRMTTRSSSGRNTPTSRPNSRASTPPFHAEYTTRSRASTPAANSSRASTPDLYCTRISRSRSRSASSEYDVTDSSSQGQSGGRVTRSRADRNNQSSAESHQVTTRSRSERGAVSSSDAEKTDFKLPASIFRVSCSQCGKRMLKDSLGPHIERKHSDNSVSSSSESNSRSGNVESTTRSGRVRKLDWNPQPEIREEVDMEEEEGVDCPMCFIKIPKLKFLQHFDETHSPARKITRKQFQDVRGEDVLSVHASTDSPCKIFNINSPIKDDEPDSTTTIDYKKELNF